MTGYCSSTSRNKSKSWVANFFICTFYFMFAILFILSHCLIHQKKQAYLQSHTISVLGKIYWSWFMKWLGDKFIFTSTCIAVQTILFTTSQTIYMYASVESTSYLQFLLLWNQNLLRDKGSHVLIIFISFSDRSDRGKILNNK